MDADRYRLALDNMLNGFAYHRIVLDAAGRPVDYVFLEINDAFERLTGLKRKNVLGRKVTEVLPGIEKDPTDWIGRYGRVALTGEEARFESHAEPLDRWYSVIAYRPEPEHFAVIFEEVTARKKAEERVKHLNAVLRGVRNVNQLITREPDRDRLLKGTCESLVEARGYPAVWIALLHEDRKVMATAEAGLGEDFAPVRERLVRGELPECCGRALAGEGVVTIEDPASLCPGCAIAKRYCGPAALAVRLDCGGKCYGVMVVALPAGLPADPEEMSLLQEAAGDVAFALHAMELDRDHSRATVVLRETERRLATLTRNLPGMAYRCLNDRDWTMNAVSDGCEPLTGYAPEDLVENRLVSYNDLIHPDDRQPVWDQVQEAVREKRPFELEYRIRTRSGEEKWVWEQGVGVFSGAGGLEALEGYIADVTDRRRAEEARRESEERYRDLAETTDDLVQSVSPDGSIVFVNRAWRETLGYSEEEALGLSIFDVIHPESRDHCMEIFRRVLAGEKARDIEATFVAKDGRAVLVEGSASCRFADGEPVATYGIFHDVTERRRTEAALRESEETFRSAFEHAAIGRAMATPDGRFIRVNRAFRRMLGYAEGELLSKSWRDVTHPGDMERSLENARRLLEGKAASFDTEERLLCKDGREAWVHLNVVMIRDGEGKPLHFVGDVVDVTERRRAAEALRGSEQKYRALVENTKDVAYSTDAEGRLTFLGPQAARYGIDPDEAVSRSLLEFVAPEDRERIAGEFQRTMTTGEEFPTEFRIVGADGREHWFEDEGRVLRNASGEAIGVSGALRDVTERKQLEDQFRQAQKLEAVGRLAGGVAHDFNNMLGAIIGYADLILPVLEERDPLRSDIEHIKNAADRAAGLTRQLLAFSRKQALEPRVLGLNDVIVNLEKMLHRLIGEDIELRTALAEDLGRVKADPGQVDQVIMNLAVNARDAMPEGGMLTIETANVELDEEYARSHVGVKSGPYVMLAVSDTGCGMDEATRSRIFEPFFTTKEVGKGTGLGLSTVYGIVKQSGGNIWVYSEPGKGTTFKLYFPLVEEAAEPEKAKKPAETRARGRETVLVVEDEDVLRGLVRRMLGLLDYEVLEAASGGDAFLLCERHKEPIHLMITDVVMPQMGGRQLAERVASLHPEMKVLYMSGYTDDAIVHHGVLEPGTPFLQKPFTASSLARTVRKVLDAPDERSVREQGEGESE
jgi:PAS domain S-box-containing protein